MANILDKRDHSLAPTPVGVSTDKVAKFNWAKPTTPGTLTQLHKTVLNIDDQYQRSSTSNEAVKRIARHWDWSLFGVLKVAKRPDGTYWVFDGGHRTRASFFRSDIGLLPCIVFEWDDISNEARSFIAGAKMTCRINSLDTFKAATIAMEPEACRTAALLSELGIKPSKSASKAYELKCIHTIQKAVAEDEDKSRKCLQICLVQAADEPISGNVFRGLFKLAQHCNGHDILTEQREALEALGQKEVEHAIRQLKAEYGKGGEVVEAKAILNLLNKGKRTRKLKW